MPDPAADRLAYAGAAGESADTPSSDGVVVPSEPRDAVPPLEPLRGFSDDERKRIKRVQKHVQTASRKHGVETDLINGIIWVESKFERTARRRNGPRGLMQLMPKTAKHVARQLRRKYRPYSASFNIEAGTYYFAEMLRSFEGNTVLALIAYHRGPGRVRAWLDTDEPMPDVSRRYVANVLSAAAAFRERADNL